MSELEFRDADAKRILALAPTNKWAIYAANAFTRASIVERTLFRSADEPAVARGILDELISLQGGGVQAAAGVGVGSAAGVGKGAGGPAAAAGGSCHAGAVAGLGAGSTAADGTTTSMQGASEGLATEQIAGLMSGLGAVLNRLSEMKMVLEYFIPSTVTVTPSQCSSGKRNQIEGLMRIKYDYRPDLLAPCCFGHLPVSAACPPAFEWPNPSKEDAEENVTSALACLAKLAPEGVVVLPVQDITWLQAEVVIDKTTIEVSSGRTDYIFVTKAAWARCQEEYGAKLQGRTLKVDAGHTPSEALHSMLGSICGLYEAKTPVSMLHDGVPKVRAQAVLEYMVINQMVEWPEDDVVVLFGDLNTHYAVHAGRKDPDRKAKRSLHVAGPARLQDVAQGSPAAAAYSHPASVTAAFLTALLRPRGNDATERCMEGAGSSGGGGIGGSREGAGGNQWGGDATFRSGGAANAHDGGASRSQQDASGSGDSPTGGNKDAHSSAGAADGGGEGSVSGADSSDEGGGGFDGDEGLREAAQENWDAQVFMSLLRLPEVYEALGLSQPPTSFRPPTKEEFLAGFRPWED